MSRLKNCPPDIYSNCINAATKCSSCCAGWGSSNSKLLYDPLDVRVSHPYEPPLAKRAIQKQAKLNERRIMDGIARATLRSGAACHDGDLLVLNSLRVEVKQRGKRASFNLTLSEFDKGLKQGIDIYGISIVRNDNEKSETVYMLTESLLGKVLALIKTHGTQEET